MSLKSMSTKSSDESPKPNTIRDLGWCMVTWDSVTNTFYIRGRDGFVSHGEKTTRMTVTSHWGDGGEFRALTATPSDEDLVPQEAGVDRVVKKGECGYQGCTKKVRAKGYCQTHYTQRERTGNMWAIGEKKGYDDPADLVLTYMPDLPQKDQKNCSFPECLKPRTTKGTSKQRLCAAHSKQWYRHRELRPLKEFVRRQDEEMARLSGLLQNKGPGSYDAVSGQEQPVDCPGTGS